VCVASYLLASRRSSGCRRIWRAEDKRWQMRCVSCRKYEEARTLPHPPTSLTSVIAGVEADSASAGKTRDDGRRCADLKMEASEEKLCKNEDGSRAKTIDVAERVDMGLVREGTI
jgi:hypothetical protein